MKALFLFISISCLAPFVSAQMILVSGRPDAAFSKSIHHCDPVPKDLLAIRAENFLSSECTTDLQVYLDLNAVCNKLALAGPNNNVLIKRVARKERINVFDVPSENNFWIGIDDLKLTGKTTFKNLGENDINLFSAITRRLNSYKTMKAGIVSDSRLH